MKKIIIFSLILLGLGFSPLLVKADILPPPNTHYLIRCPKIVNLDDFPEILLIGVQMSEASSWQRNSEIINNGECLRRVSQYDNYNIYLIGKEKFNSTKLENLDIKNDLTLLISIPKLTAINEHVDNKNPIKQETIEYSLEQFSDGKIILYKSKKITEYNNGTPDKVEIFGTEKVQKVIGDTKKTIDDTRKVVDNGIKKIDDGIKEVEKVQKRGFWNSIWCFLGFSRYCD